MCASSSCSLVQTLQTDHRALKKSSPMCGSQLYITESKQSVSRTLSHLLLSPCLPAPLSVCFHPLICSSLNACFSLPLILWIFLCWWVHLLQWLKPVFIFAALSLPQLSVTEIRGTIKIYSTRPRKTSPSMSLYILQLTLSWLDYYMTDSPVSDPTTKSYSLSPH